MKLKEIGFAAIIATTICFVNQFEQRCTKRKIESFKVKQRALNGKEI